MNGLTTASRDRLFMSAEAVVPIALNALAAMVVAVVLACPLRWLGGSAPRLGGWRLPLSRSIGDGVWSG